MQEHNSQPNVLCIDIVIIITITDCVDLIQNVFMLVESRSRKQVKYGKPDVHLHSNTVSLHLSCSQLRYGL